jgi:hypothetical protein
MQEAIEKAFDNFKQGNKMNHCILIDSLKKKIICQGKDQTNNQKNSI